MLRANDYLINQIPAESGGGVFGPGSGFGPVPDGQSIPNMPLISFLKGRYNKKLKSMIVGNMVNEVRTRSSSRPPPTEPIMGG